MSVNRRRTWSLYSWIMMTFVFGFLGIIMLFATGSLADNFFKPNP